MVAEIPSLRERKRTLLSAMQHSSCLEPAYSVVALPPPRAHTASRLAAGPEDSTRFRSPIASFLPRFRSPVICTIPISTTGLPWQTRASTPAA